MYYWRSSRETPHQAAARGPAGPTRCIGRYGRWYSALYSVLVRDDSSSGGGGGWKPAQKAGLGWFDSPEGGSKRRGGPGIRVGSQGGHPFLEKGPLLVRTGATPCQKRSRPLSEKEPYLVRKGAIPWGGKGVAVGQTRGHSFSRRGPPLFSPEAAPLGVRGPYLV